MASERIQMIFLTIFSLFILMFLMPNYLGFMPNILVLSSPFVIFIVFLEYNKMFSFRSWMSIQIVSTSFLLLLTLFIK
jgi:hypothetical protein